MPTDAPSAPTYAGTSDAPQIGVVGENLLLDLFVAYQHVGELLDVALSGTGVRPTEYAVISQLGSGALTPGGLRQRLGTTKSTLTGHLAALERRGQLHRRPHPEDGRSHLVELTAIGRRTLEHSAERFRDALAAFEFQFGHDPAPARAMLLDVDTALTRAAVELAATKARTAVTSEIEQ